MNGAGGDYFGIFDSPFRVEVGSAERRSGKDQ